jgi:AraC-like DNA-binding protein
VYASLGQPFCIRVEGRTWENVELAVAPAYVPHLVSCERHIGVFRLESETVDPMRLPSFLPTVGAFEDSALLNRIRDAFARLRAADPGIDPRSIDMDALILGVPIAQRRLDPRIALVAERIRQRPCAPVDADSWAEQVDLSCSRFLHLFKYEIGTTFRRFRAWKRARSLLSHLSRQLNLSDLALELGYPDATHFSHSVRNFYGFSPKELFAGGRRFVVVTQHEPERITLLAG